MVDFRYSEEQKALVETARRFAREKIVPIAAECDRQARFPMDVFELAWQIGLVNVTCPARYGGAGMGHLDNALIAEELAYGCSGIQASIQANQLALAAVGLAGQEEQKQKYMGILTRGPTMASLATTEPDAGSDVAGIRTRFTRHGDAYVITGQKAWITNASYARFYIVFATEDPALRHKGIAAFIVDRDLRGVSVGNKENKVGQRASDTRTLHLDDVQVPASNLLAPPPHGFKLAMECFNQTRPDIGAASAGLMRRALDESIGYARDRKAFGVPIAEHQLVQAMIAEMAIRYEAARLLYQKAASDLDQGVRDPMVSSFAKAFGADAAMQTAVDAVQVFGGNGCAADYPVEKLMRDAKILQIYEGTSQIQRLVIARRLLAR